MKTHRFPTLLFATAVCALLSVSAQPAKNAQESKPVLVSRTGGGGWANVKELEAAAVKGNPKAEAQ